MNRRLVTGCMALALSAGAAGETWKLDEWTDDMTGKTYIVASAPYVDVMGTTRGGRVHVRCRIGALTTDVHFTFEYLNLTGAVSLGGADSYPLLVKFGDAEAGNWGFGTGQSGLTLFVEDTGTHWAQRFAFWSSTVAMSTNRRRQLMLMWQTGGNRVYSDPYDPTLFARQLARHPMKMRLRYYKAGNVDISVPAPPKEDNPIEAVLAACDVPLDEVSASSADSASATSTLAQ